MQEYVHLLGFAFVEEKTKTEKDQVSDVIYPKDW